MQGLIEEKASAAEAERDSTSGSLGRRAEMSRSDYAGPAVWPLSRAAHRVYLARSGVIPGIVRMMVRSATTLLEPRDLEALNRRLRPGFAVWRAFVDAANAYIQFRRFDEADAVLSRGLGAFPNDGTLIRALATSAHDRGDFEVAIDRWEAAARAEPDNPFCVCALSANLRADHQIWQASAVMTDALQRFPTTVEVIAEAARTAMARRSFKEALDLWTLASADEDPLPDWLHGRIDALARLGRLDEAETVLQEARKCFADDTGFMALADIFSLVRRDRDETPETAASEIVISPADLVAEFESLGDNCEFGLLQRYCGIEPLGLFRFSGTQSRNLQHAFATNLDEYGADEDLNIFATTYDQEYVCRSRRYEDFEYHTEVYEGQGSLDILRAREIRKVAYLKERMLLDLRSGEKIFVRKGGPYQAAVDMHRTMRQLGPNVLLWVQLADDDHPPGFVEIIEDGLLRGFISRFPTYDDAHAFELRDWLTICANALALVKGMQGQECRYRLTDNKIVQVDQVWEIEARCVSQSIVRPSFIHEPVYKLTLSEDTQRSDALVARRALAPVTPRSFVTFSVWVFVPDTFQGSFIDVYFINAPSGFIMRANLTKRQVWQRVWCSSRMPKGQVQPIAGLRITGVKDATIYVSTWRVEQGCVPNDWPLGEDILHSVPEGASSSLRTALAAPPHTA